MQQNRPDFEPGPPESSVRCSIHWSVSGQWRRNSADCYIHFSLLTINCLHSQTLTQVLIPLAELSPASPVVVNENTVKQVGKNATDQIGTPTQPVRGSNHWSTRPPETERKKSISESVRTRDVCETLMPPLDIHYRVHNRLFWEWMETANNCNFSKSKGHNSVQNGSIVPKTELDLDIPMIILCIKFHFW
jgi:hypothetical protein